MSACQRACLRTCICALAFEGMERGMRGCVGVLDGARGRQVKEEPGENLGGRVESDATAQGVHLIICVADEPLAAKLPVSSRTHQREYACSACWPTDPSGLLWRDKPGHAEKQAAAPTIQISNGILDCICHYASQRLVGGIRTPCRFRHSDAMLVCDCPRCRHRRCTSASADPLAAAFLTVAHQMIHFLLPPCLHHSTAISTKRKSAVHNRYDEAMQLYYPAARRYGMQSHRLVHRLVRDQMMFSP